MRSEDRKAAIAAFKKAETATGIYRVQCLPSGQLWLGRAANLGKIENRLRFMLEHGSHPRRDLQQAWRAHGGGAFAIGPVEELEPESDAYLRDRQLQARLEHWCRTLDAPAL